MRTPWSTDPGQGINSGYKSQESLSNRLMPFRKEKDLRTQHSWKECYLQNKDNTGSQSDLWDQNMALYQSLKSHASTESNDTEDSQHILRIYFVPGTVLHTSQILAYLVFARWKFTPSSTEGIKRESQSHMQSPSSYMTGLGAELRSEL